MYYKWDFSTFRGLLRKFKGFIDEGCDWPNVNGFGNIFLDLKQEFRAYGDYIRHFKYTLDMLDNLDINEEVRPRSSFLPLSLPLPPFRSFPRSSLLPSSYPPFPLLFHYPLFFLLPFLSCDLSVSSFMISSISTFYFLFFNFSSSPPYFLVAFPFLPFLPPSPSLPSFSPLSFPFPFLQITTVENCYGLFQAITLFIHSQLIWIYY